ncbi:MAG: hypothetical protein O4805_09055 [Trichodesmium sp. St16_bin2-tuft]|jgi:hypothetical protein|nr:hypothetical protein [Trichodesmium sp. St16_bin2-tuft]
MPKGKTWPIGLPPFHERYLLLWAYCKGTSKTALSQNIVQARLEANREDIEIMLQQQANDWGISLEEATARILAIMKYDPSAGNIETEPSDD